MNKFGAFSHSQGVNLKNQIFAFRTGFSLSVSMLYHSSLWIRWISCSHKSIPMWLHFGGGDPKQGVEMVIR